jgi:YHS domain-containing protein
MWRAILELLFTIVIAMAARAILGSIFRGFASGISNANRQAPPPPSGDKSTGPSTVNALHKDPNCGTYVSESTPFKRQLGNKAFFYCSEACREAHTLAAR